MGSGWRAAVPRGGRATALTALLRSWQPWGFAIRGCVPAGMVRPVSWLAFIASLVHSLAWPVGVVAVVTVLRRPIGAVLNHGIIRRLRAGPVQLMLSGGPGRVIEYVRYYRGVTGSGAPA